jgi:hypothetical protein
MSKKRSGGGNSAPLTCSKCGMKAVSTPSTRHRRCGGQADAALRARGTNLPSADRGIWQ